MNKIIDTYFALLRHAIGLEASSEKYRTSFQELVFPVRQGQPSPCLETVEDIEAIVQLAQRQGTGPLVFDQLLRDGAIDDRLQAIGLLMKQVCMQNMMLQEQMKAVQAKTLSALSEGCVDAIIFKGFALAQHYPKPHLRQWGDIDIYVGAKGYHQGAKILRQTWPDRPCFQEEEEFYKHWNVDFENTAIEMHRVSAVLLHPSDRRLWLKLETKAMEEATWMKGDGFIAKVPEAKWNVLFVFLHSWQHYTDSRSASIKQLCDVAMCLKATNSRRQDTDELDRYLRKNLRKLRLTQVWEAYAWIMVEKLGVPASWVGVKVTNSRIQMRGERLLQRLLNPIKVYNQPSTLVNKNIILRKYFTLTNKITCSFSLWEISPVYVLHDIIGKILDGLSRLLRGELNRTWE